MLPCCSPLVSCPQLVVAEAAAGAGRPRNQSGRGLCPPFIAGRSSGSQRAQQRGSPDLVVAYA